MNILKIKRFDQTKYLHESFEKFQGHFIMFIWYKTGFKQYIYIWFTSTNQGLDRIYTVLTELFKVIYTSM